MVVLALGLDDDISSKTSADVACFARCRDLRPAEWFPTKRPWRILLVDDNPAIRTALKMLLEEHADLHLVGEASNTRRLLPTTHPPLTQ